jgi:hypothetical protein
MQHILLLMFHIDISMVFPSVLFLDLTWGRLNTVPAYYIFEGKIAGNYNT